MASAEGGAHSLKVKTWFCHLLVGGLWESDVTSLKNPSVLTQDREQLCLSPKAVLRVWRHV